MKAEDLKIKIFADEASCEAARQARKTCPRVCGFTTNPALMARQSGGASIHYESYARQYLEMAEGLPVSFEVLAPRVGKEMEAQARRIASWGSNVIVKIPIIDVDGADTWLLIRTLAHDGVCVNVTVVMTTHQLWSAVAAMRGGAPGVISIFAGRIADTGVDPTALFHVARKDVYPSDPIKLLWASTRQIRDVVLAEECGADIITMTPALLAKLPRLGVPLTEVARATVEEFARLGEEVVL